eukprot:3428060-Amphidinium_carterae.2
MVALLRVLYCEVVRPRLYHVIGTDKPLILYTDGAVEGDSAGGGAVLDLRGVVRLLQFGLNGATLDSLRKRGIKHATAQMEFLA